MIASLLTRVLGAAAGEWVLKKLLGTRLGRFGLGAVGLTLLVIGFKVWLGIHDHSIRTEASRTAREICIAEHKAEKDRLEKLHEQKIRELEQSESLEEAKRLARLSEQDREINDLLIEIGELKSAHLPGPDRVGSCDVPEHIHGRVLRTIRSLPLGGPPASPETGGKAR